MPRQLKRSGMTANVPYYGGRLGPAQAYAASHAAQRVPPPPAAPATPMAGPAPAPGTSPLAAVPDPLAAQHAAAVQQLAAAGLLTPQEAATVRARLGA
ncbi:MAG TPA: hypothetical protein VF143_04995 [Candidatus Nanopelagicales bacterium]